MLKHTPFTSHEILGTEPHKRQQMQGLDFETTNSMADLSRGTRATCSSHVIWFEISPLPTMAPIALFTSMPTLLRPLRPISHLRNAARHLSVPSRPHRPPRSQPTGPPITKTHPTATPTPTTLPRPRPARTTLSVLVFFASWFPAFSFLTNNVFCIMSVTGPSMSPFLNADYNSSMASDRVWVNMWRAGEGVKRGMVVVYRYICPLDGGFEIIWGGGSRRRYERLGGGADECAATGPRRTPNGSSSSAS